MIEVASLIAPVSEDSPCGPNLEYDPAFADLTRAAEGTPERQIGDTIEQAKEPDWLDVQQRALALFPRTKDLRVAVLFSRALVRTGELEGLSTGMSVIAGLLTRYWDSVHPIIEDDNDATARLNALASLATGERGDPSGLLRDVWNAPIAASAQGRVSVRDVLVSKNLLQAASGAQRFGADELQGLLRDAAAKGPLPIDAALKAVQALDTIRSSLAAKVNSADIPNLQVLTGALIPVVEALKVASGIEPVQPIAGDGSAISAAPVRSGDGEIRGREDAVRQLERICEFIQRTEPGNPAPLLIRRAQRLMTKDFLGIIKDLAPGSLDEIQKIAGTE